MTSTTQKLDLGFYDPRTRRSIVGYQPDGSPIWLTWRDSGGIVLVGDTGAGRTYLLDALLRGMVKDVDVSTFNVATDDHVVEVLRDVSRSFATPSATSNHPRLFVIDGVVRGIGTSDLWDAIDAIARFGRTHNVAVLVSAQSASSIPGGFTESAATILGLRQRDSRNVDTLPEDMRAAVRAASELPHGQFPLVMSTWRAGVETTFPMPMSCDCVQRATALLSEHAAHVA